jgi:hypothetical protein
VTGGWRELHNEEHRDFLKKDLNWILVYVTIILEPGL